MPCYHPLHGYRSKSVNASGKRSIVFTLAEGFKDLPVVLPCGRCIDCKLNRSRTWAVRCIHEASLHKENCFVTLTYSDDNLPENGSLNVKHFQDFMKRLRWHFSEKEIRFFHCGEYGERTSRPHYHACLFGVDFEDKVHWKTVNRQPYYVSETLKRLWPHGHSTIGNVTFESAAYVARYIVKKQTGPGSEIYYEKIDEETGEITELKREYVTMSRRPGIGKNWYEKFKADAFPHDFLVVRGVKMKPPKYYLQQLEQEHERAAKKIAVRRKIKSKKLEKDNTWDRLRVKETLHAERLKRLKREYEQCD